MNTLPTYNEQFNKITEAYIRGEIWPEETGFCFCGNLCNNKSGWHSNTLINHKDFMGYRGADFVRMETALFNEVFFITKNGNWWVYKHQINTPQYETALFNGMTAALEVLKQIHIERGEVIDEAPVFRKRNNPQQLCAGVIG